mgnify:CR=1 FL=1
MAEQVFPTKGNLIKAKRSLQQAKQGFELMDRKRNVLIREMVALTDKSKLVRGNIEQTYEKAYAALQKANITLGSVSTLTQFVPEETDLKISFRSVMGVELPTVELPDKPIVPQYDIAMTNSYLDNAYICFNETKKLTVVLAEIENSIYAEGKRTGKNRINKSRTEWSSICAALHLYLINYTSTKIAPLAGTVTVSAFTEPFSPSV